MTLKPSVEVYVLRRLLNLRANRGECFYLDDVHSLRHSDSQHFSIGTVERYLRAVNEKYGLFEVIDKTQCKRRFTVEADHIIRLIRSIQTGQSLIHFPASCERLTGTPAVTLSSGVAAGKSFGE